MNRLRWMFLSVFFLFLSCSIPAIDGSGADRVYRFMILSPSDYTEVDLPFPVEGLKAADIDELVVQGGGMPYILDLGHNSSWMFSISNAVLGTNLLQLSPRVDGQITSNYTLTFIVKAGNSQTNAVDTNRPGVSVSSPAEGSTISNSLVSVQGTAWDDIQVDSVWVSLDSAAFVQAGGTGSFSLDVNVYASGSHSISVYAADDSGNYSLTHTVNFTVSLSDSGAGTYYNGLAGVTRQNLHDLIDGHTDLGYDYLYTLYRSSDNTSNNQVWDMYSDTPGSTPPYIYDHVSGDRCGTYNSENDCYNREHIWPQGYFNSASPMKADAHHVVPTDGYVNNRRSNYPFGEIGSAGWTSLNGSKVGSCTNSGYSGTVFEPIDAYKGDIARMMFYMSIRYYTEDGSFDSSTPFSDGASIKPWNEAVLRKWHQQDPVSQKEIDRNNAVYAEQGNRNPFIDHPEWVDQITDF